MRTTAIRRGILLCLALGATLIMAACTSGNPPTSAGQGTRHTAPPAASPTPIASPLAATPSVTAPSVPSASPWLAASEIPFGATYNWSLFNGTANEAPIGTPEGNGVYYISPDTVFQAITSCGGPSLILSKPLGARQRIFKATSGRLQDLAGQFISFYPDATSAQAAWQRLQAAYAGCLAQEPNPHITLTETAQTPDGMAWFHSTNGEMVGSVSPYAHEYFVLQEKEIAYVYVEGAGPALANTPNDGQVLATIARHFSA